MELRVKVHQRNDTGHIIALHEYALKDYVDMIRMDLFRVITDVENVFYRLNDGKPRSEWAIMDLDEFNRIRHKLLDKAGDLERMPSNIEAVRTSYDLHMLNWPYAASITECSADTEEEEK